MKARFKVTGPDGKTRVVKINAREREVNGRKEPYVLPADTHAVIQQVFHTDKTAHAKRRSPRHDAIKAEIRKLHAMTPDERAKANEAAKAKMLADFKSGAKPPKIEPPIVLSGYRASLDGFE